MTSPLSDQLITTFPVAGTDEVERLTYVDGRVWINEEQYFGDVPEEAWDFYIGGYQPAQKWLKDRRGRKLSSDDIEHYQRIIVVLTKTRELMQEVGQQ